MYRQPRRQSHGGSSRNLESTPQTIAKIDGAVVKAHSDLLAAGESISAWKVSQSALVILKAVSFESLGFRMQKVPSLYRLMITEAKINSFIHCFVGVQKITSLHDLEMAICESEGIKSFEELELGPMLKHPLVEHYFSVGPDVTEILKITSEQIVAYLSILLRKKRKISVDDLLDYIAKRKKESPENLCVRIQSLGMHIGNIMRGRRSEFTLLKKCSDGLAADSKLDDNEDDDNGEAAKDEDNENNDGLIQDSGISSCQTATSSDPSSSAHVPRVWLDTEMDCSFPSSQDNKRCTEHGASSEGKVAPENIFCTKYVTHRTPKKWMVGIKFKPEFQSGDVETGFIDDNAIDGHTWMFIKIWKDTCEKDNVVDVYGKMLAFYNNGTAMKPKKKNKALKLIMSYPYVGLLNVAIASIKFGFWERMSSTPQANRKEVLTNTSFMTCTHDANTDVDPAEKDVLEGHAGIALKDILKCIKTYVFPDHVLDTENSYPKNQLIFLREICKLEQSITQQLLLNDFEILGFGDIFTFLADHISLLPTAWQKSFLITDKSEKPLVKVIMSQHYLLEFLSQAANSLGENETLSKLMVSKLLKMQFSSAGLSLLEDDFTADLLTAMSKNGHNPSSNSVLFSSTLSTFGPDKDLSDTYVDTKETIEVLLRAPMLLDLAAWSHWDIKFAPSLGPLVGWLLSDVTTKELLCLVTKDGKVLRIDHSATVDSFFEAFLHGSSFETSLKLLSLIGLYGGEQNLPLSLLRNHAKIAFEVILDKNDLKKAARFLLDCLGYLPKEFQSFAAELLVSAFRLIIKDAHLVILRECRSKEDHMMIHELGLLLGIVEWFDDHCTCLSESKESPKRFSSEDEVINSSLEVEQPTDDYKRDSLKTHRLQSGDGNFIRSMSESERENDAANIIESIRIEEFGLDPNISSTESNILKKQHARLGRALHCLSQELYSQDSHFLLELVQNADDNVYPRNVEPTLTFILEEKSIIVMNNEVGFSGENIRALCDVGNSTKKASNAGYIGKKGIGFKSVFRVTDAPEIHSNGFHIKFDLTEGQIGFVLPTIVPPCDIDLFTNLVAFDTNEQVNIHQWNTCIVLPFKSNLTETSGLDNITSMFMDLHPSLLLFLHRLQCIKFRNMLTDSFVTMRKEIVGNGLVNVSHGNKTLTWFVESRKLQANGIRDDAKTTEISIAFPLEESDDGNYIPKMDQQYVFAFLPLRTYGFKFIIQGDFILPSSREEVDGDSPWNQWLLSEFPNLFVSSQRSFRNIPGFHDCIGKGVSAFLRYVPLVGEVHGFFSSLPRMIISKLCTSNCLLLEGENDKWVPPCRVLRNWNEQARKLMPDSLIQKHLGLGYLNKDIVISDSLARALGIENYGPKILVQMLSSLCHTKEGVRSMGLSWLSSWLSSFHAMFLPGASTDIMNTLRRTPFIPLLDGGYSSIDEGMIWMNLDGSWTKSDRLFSNLRVVNPALFDSSNTENLTQILSKVGVQKLSAHQVVKAHVLPAVCDKRNTLNEDIMTEYLLFIMVHLQSRCSNCCIEREHIISEVYNNAFILTNHGFVLPSEVPIHFNNDFGNCIDTRKLINGIDVKWYEVDNTYLNYPVDDNSVLNWRKFFQELQITDFVQIVRVEKTVSGSTISDWESRELVDLLAKLSASGDREKCKHLLEVLDTIWDDYFSDKVVSSCHMDGETMSFRSAVATALNDVPWVVSSMDDGLCYPKDLFHDCEAVRSILGDKAPYAVPKIQSEKLITSIGFKVAVTLHDALSVLEIWKRSATSFKASILQMSRFYSFLWNELGSSNQNFIVNFGSEAFIFVPFSSVSSSEIVPGVLLSPQEVYWHDGMINPENEFSKMLSTLYPSLHDFFVNHCGVKENPPLLDYLALLRHLSTVDTPTEAAKKVFDVFVMWGDGIKSGLLSLEDVEMLKKNLEQKETKVLPIANNKWVSLHPSFGLVCWCDDENLAKEFEDLNNIDFIRLCELITDEEKEMLQLKVSVLMKMLGIPALSEVVTREAIYYGPVDNSYETSLLSWVLPYAQRYISNTYPERYLQLKLFGFERLNRLQIVVVEKLFYKNVIKRSKFASKKRHDTSCLFQDEILYATPESDSHSIFMELSRFLFNGKPELHLANFLHMLTTKTESGSTEEQIETFVLNSQKVAKLPDDEPVWSFQPTAWNLETSPTTRIAKRIANPTTSSQSNRNWPPASWKTAPKFNLNDLKINDVAKQVENSNHQGEGGTNIGDCVTGEPDLVELDGPTSFSERDQLSHGTPNGQQAVLTGRRGEEVAFKYYSRKVGENLVKWVNEACESGLPYDIEVYDEENRKEYIEVKTTDSASKDWFELSVREWEFAVEEGECYSIVRVVLSGDETGRVTVFKNPARLCRLGLLKLAVLMSKQQKEEFVLC
ncbi:hypothetical protein L2E82_04710 [Cichorium intybus]|uniref:Uncharacterized protein n=1 Tax=Cichorium intybus TaxID=13427 RepID=A0ACB9H7G9_CICIN|nr:hypothetical protein L2E82_04710 [Cichorium intybus]